jgi:hypothetical protein
MAAATRGHKEMHHVGSVLGWALWGGPGGTSIGKPAESLAAVMRGAGRRGHEEVHRSGSVYGITGE